MHTAINGRRGAISSISSAMQRLSAGPAGTAKPYKISDLIPKSWDGRHEKGQFRNFMVELHLWIQAWSDRGERILVRIESADKVERSTLAAECTEADFRTLETALYGLGTRLARASRKLGLRVGGQFKKLVSQEKEILGFDTRRRLCGDRIEGECGGSQEAAGERAPNPSNNSWPRERRESSVVRPKANQQVQISCGHMLVPQSRQSGHNIRSERVVSESVRFFATQCHQIEAALSVLDGREAMGPSVRIREHECRGGTFLRLRVGWRQKRGNLQARESRL